MKWNKCDSMIHYRLINVLRFVEYSIIYAVLVQSTSVYCFLKKLHQLNDLYMFFCRYKYLGALYQMPSLIQTRQFNRNNGRSRERENWPLISEWFPEDPIEIKIFQIFALLYFRGCVLYSKVCILPAILSERMFYSRGLYNTNPIL